MTEKQHLKVSFGAMETYEKMLSTKRIYDGRIINLRNDTVLLPNHQTALREVIEHSGGVCVLPITDKGTIIFVRQFRYPYNCELLEIPAGKKAPDETPLACGIRELKEETGCTAKELLLLGELYPSPSYLNEIIYMYLARGLSEGEKSLDDDEFLNTEEISFEKSVEMVLSGEIKDAKTQTAILKAKLLLGI